MNCDNCGRTISESVFTNDADRHYCEECAAYLADLQRDETEPQRYVTREMALDAGEPDMEGMQW